MNDASVVKMNTYRGVPDPHGAGTVTLNGQPLDPCNDIVNHSPDGFNWGYGGSGPAQLALAMMCSEYGPDVALHPISYDLLKWRLISALPKDEVFEFSRDFLRMIVAKLQIEPGWLPPTSEEEEA